ncbi:hypothetical protein LTR15_004980 [Elasticomyces elasticus]|nr:hypothetical protein LTR15_004980 [Elasticomyces elasticus]
MANTITDQSLLREILPLRKPQGSVSRRTPQQLRRMYERAKAKGDPGVTARNVTSSYEEVESWLAETETALQHGQPVTSTQRSDSGLLVDDDSQAKLKSAEWMKRKLEGTSPPDVLDSTTAEDGPKTKRAKTANSTRETSEESGKAGSKTRKKTIQTPDKDKDKRMVSMYTIKAISLAKPVFYTNRAEFEEAREEQEAEEKRLVKEKAAAARKIAREKKAEEELKLARKCMASVAAAKAVERSVSDTTESVNESQAAKLPEADNASEDQKCEIDQIPLNAGEEDDFLREYREIAREHVLKGMDCTRLWRGAKNIFTAGLKGDIEVVPKSQPTHLPRVHSREGARHTQGIATQWKIQPSASEAGRPLHDSIYAFPDLISVIKNLGNRILWNRRPDDEFTSYSKSPLFILVHTILRRTLKNKHITISWIDTTQATRNDGKPAEFYDVTELKRILGVIKWAGWNVWAFLRLKSPWYTHEYVAHGEVNLGTNAFRQVTLKELESHRLYNFAPEFHCDEDDEEVVELPKLVYRCTQLRCRIYTEQKPEPFTREHLEHAARLARLFVPGNVVTDSAGVETKTTVRTGPIPLHIFLNLVSLSNRHNNDSVFISFIKTHFTANDVEDLKYPGMTNVAPNLPECMQFLQRFREACTALHVTSPGPTAVTPVDILYDMDGKWHGKWKDITSPKQLEQNEGGANIVQIKKGEVKKGKLAQARDIAGISEEEIATREGSSELEDDQDDGMGVSNEFDGEAAESVLMPGL